MNLFAYGTLMEPRLVKRVIGSVPASESASLPGYQRFAFKEECYPGIVPSHKNGSITGTLFFNLHDISWRYLDGFEGSMYARRSVYVNTASGDEYAAETYVVREAYKHLLAKTDWNFSQFLRRDLGRYLGDE